MLTFEVWSYCPCHHVLAFQTARIQRWRLSHFQWLLNDCHLPQHLQYPLLPGDWRCMGEGEPQKGPLPPGHSHSCPWDRGIQTSTINSDLQARTFGHILKHCFKTIRSLLQCVFSSPIVWDMVIHRVKQEFEAMADIYYLLKLRTKEGHQNSSQNSVLTSQRLTMA